MVGYTLNTGIVDAKTFSVVQGVIREMKQRSMRVTPSSGEDKQPEFFYDGSRMIARTNVRIWGSDYSTFDGMAAMGDRQVYMECGNGQVVVKCPRDAIAFLEDRMKESFECYELMSNNVIVDHNQWTGALRVMRQSYRIPGWFRNHSGTIERIGFHHEGGLTDNEKQNVKGVMELAMDTLEEAPVRLKLIAMIANAFEIVVEPAVIQQLTEEARAVTASLTQHLVEDEEEDAGPAAGDQEDGTHFWNMVDENEGDGGAPQPKAVAKGKAKAKAKAYVRRFT